MIINECSALVHTNMTTSLTKGIFHLVDDNLVEINLLKTNLHSSCHQFKLTSLFVDTEGWSGEMVKDLVD